MDFCPYGYRAGSIVLIQEVVSYFTDRGAVMTELNILEENVQFYEPRELAKLKKEKQRDSQE